MGSRYNIPKPLSLNYAGALIAFAMVMTMLGIGVFFTQLEDITSVYLLFLLILGATVFASLRYLIDLERGKPGVRRIHCIALLTQLGVIALTASFDLFNGFFGVAIALDLIALGLLYYPRTTYWLENVRYQDDN